MAEFKENIVDLIKASFDDKNLPDIINELDQQKKLYQQKQQSIIIEENDDDVVSLVNEDEELNEFQFDTNLRLKSADELQPNDLVLIKNMRMVDSAKTFLHNILDANAEIIIISKHVKPYIKAVLEANDFKPEEIKKIKIDCSLRDKGAIVNEFEQESKFIPKLTIVCDDDIGDLSNVCKAIEKQQPTAEIISKCAEPGKFDYAALQDEVIEKLKKLSSPSP